MGSRLFFCRTERLQSFTLRVEQIPVLVKEDEGLGLLRQLSKNNKTNVLKLFYFPRHNRMKLFLKKHCNFNVPALIIIYFWNIHKVKKILKESLDLISSPSPTVKIQIIGGKVCLGVEAKHCWAFSTNFWNKKFVDIPQQCLPQVKFPAKILNFHWSWRWWDW